MGQSSKVKGSMDSPYEIEARESKDDKEQDNRTCWNKRKWSTKQESKDRVFSQKNWQSS